MKAKVSGNVWMIAFFIMLLLAEFAREWAVIEANEQPAPNASGMFNVYDDFVEASGEWVRVDAGKPIERQATNIVCTEEYGTCVEAHSRNYEDSVFPPEITTHKATFTEEVITYQNVDPTCVQSIVTIDKRARSVTSSTYKKTPTYLTRRSVPNIDATCAKVENKIVTQLKESQFKWKDPTEDHFLPIFSILFYLEK